MNAAQSKKPRSPKTSLAAAIQACDARSAKQEVARLLSAKELPAVELPYLYAACVRDLLVGAEYEQGDKLPGRLVFSDPSDVVVHLELLIDELCAGRRNAAIETTLEDEIFSFVDAHIYLPELSLSMVAEQFHQQKSTLSALFKREKKMNYVDYINRTRVIRATQLLRNAESDASLESIGFAVGYISQSTFRRNFAKYTSCTPSQYRRLISR